MAKEKAQEENKITQHQLSKLLNFEENFKKARDIVGGMTLQYEFQKASLLGEISKIESDYNKFKEDLKEQYGEVDIDTSTGVYTLKGQEVTE